MPTEIRIFQFGLDATRPLDYELRDEMRLTKTAWFGIEPSAWPEARRLIVNVYAVRE